MAPGVRASRPRVESKENDENSGTTRLTRAKAAAASTDDAMPRKALETVNDDVKDRKRAVLGDVSNLSKADGKDGKKAGAKTALTAKAGLASKAAQPRGVQKNTTRPASRTALASKNPNTKRTASGSGALGAGAGLQKRKIAPSGTASSKELDATDERGPARKKANTANDENATRVKTSKAIAQAKSLEPTVAPEAVPEDQGLMLEEAAEFKAQSEPPVQEPDPDDLGDPLMVAEYSKEIFEYLLELEVKSLPNSQYMSHQDDLEWKTRGILIDWLIEVHTRFHLLPETLFLAVNIIDRFLSEKVVQLDRLQLVGITAMFIASKYEEVLSPHVENFKRIADDGFSEAEILSAERFVLSTLNYDLSYPNPMNFLRRVSKADNYDIQSRTVGKYLMEISLLDHRFMEYRPSLVAAAAMYLSRLMLDRGEWDEVLCYYAGYDEDEIEPVARLMVDYLARPVTHEAFFKKYASKKFVKASIHARQWAKKNAVHFDVPRPELSLDQVS